MSNFNLLIDIDGKRMGRYDDKQQRFVEYDQFVGNINAYRYELSWKNRYT